MNIKKTFTVEQLIEATDKLLSINPHTATLEEATAAIKQYITDVDPIAIRFALEYCRTNGVAQFHVFEIPGKTPADLPEVKPMYPSPGGKYDA